MDYQLQARTPAGEHLVSLAESLAETFAPRAAEHDRQGTFPHDNIADLKAANYFYAPAPRELGGLGVESVHDLYLASSRLARGDASTAIAVNMHLMMVIALVRQYRTFQNTGRHERARAVETVLRRFIERQEIIAAAVSEPDQNLLRPNTIGTRHGDGWLVTGRKIFGSLSPAATQLITSLTITDDEGIERFAYAYIPADAPGVTMNDDWDALGMRGSGSQSITLDNVYVPANQVTSGFRTGSVSGMLERNLTNGIAHASASLGIAETAVGIAVKAAASRREKRNEPVRPTIQLLAADNAIDLAAMRAVFGRAAGFIDDYFEAYPASFAPAEATVALAAEVQAAKAFLNEAGVRVVDRAMTITGGAAYMNGHPISRLYRDVRAGAFMNPMSANIAYEFVGTVALGIIPESL